MNLLESLKLLKLLVSTSQSETLDERNRFVLIVQFTEAYHLYFLSI